MGKSSCSQDPTQDTKILFNFQLCSMIMCLICSILKSQEWARYQLLSPQE